MLSPQWHAYCPSPEENSIHQDVTCPKVGPTHPTPNIYILLFLFFSSHSVAIHTSWSECWYWSRWRRWQWRSWRWRWLWSRLGCVQRTGLRVGRACYQSHTHPLEPFNWDGDGVRGIYDAQHPIFDLYVTPFGDYQKLGKWRLKTKACSSKNIRDIRLVAFMMFINLQSLLVTLVTTENRTKNIKYQTEKMRMGWQFIGATGTSWLPKYDQKI